MKQIAIISLLLMLLMTSFQLNAENYKPLTLHNRELLSSDKVLYVMQDAASYAGVIGRTIQLRASDRNCRCRPAFKKQQRRP